MRALRSTMGKKILLSMHPRNFGPDKIVRTYVQPEVKCREKRTGTHTEFFSMKRVGRKFHVVIVENKAMCKKVFCTCKVVVVVFFAN